MPTKVLICGGGTAGLEAALALHRLAGDRVATTVLAPDTDFSYRPLSVLSPFAAGGAMSYPLERVAADAGFTHVHDRLERVDVAGHEVHTLNGRRLPYDVLLVASGAHAIAPFSQGVAFTGSPADEERLHGLVQDVEGGYVHSLAFVVPEGNTWPLPLYELALMFAERAFSLWVELDLHLVTPETAPLALFGPEAARELAALLAAAGIAVHTGARAEPIGHDSLRLAPADTTLQVERIVTLPLMEGPRIAGLPSDAQGFLVTDPHGRVLGTPDVYAAGDVTAFPIKQGGLACQQADAAAASIAAGAGAAVEAEPFTPVLRGMLVTEGRARFLRRDPAAGDAVAGRALWWPPSKVAGRELAGYLEGLDQEAGRSGLPVNVSVGEAAPGAFEVLSVP